MHPKRPSQHTGQEDSRYDDTQDDTSADKAAPNEAVADAGLHSPPSHHDADDAAYGAGMPGNLGLPAQHETIYALLTAIPDSLYLAHRDGTILGAKPRRGDPVSAEVLVGKHLSELLPPEEAARALSLLETALASRDVQVMEFRFRVDGRDYDREARIVAYGTDRVVVLVRDISARKRAEAMLLQTRLYESLSALSAGIAHVFNNRLMAILGQAELARDEAPAGSRVHERMKSIEQAVGEASNLVQQLLAYSGSGADTFETIALTHVLSELQPHLEQLKPRGATLHLACEDDIPSIMGNPEQLCQIVLMLVTNAFDAIDDRGEVRIWLGRLASDSLVHTLDTSPDDIARVGHVVLEVTDDGRGMHGSIQARMFDPFFTTKARGEGWSLAVVAGIVHSHGGTIDVDSKAGQGTSVRIVLPPAAAASEAGFDPNGQPS